MTLISDMRKNDVAAGQHPRYTNSIVPEMWSYYNVLQIGTRQSTVFSKETKDLTLLFNSRFNYSNTSTSRELLGVLQGY
jgi:hypothetical protein